MPLKAKQPKRGRRPAYEVPGTLPWNRKDGGGFEGLSLNALRQKPRNELDRREASYWLWRKRHARSSLLSFMDYSWWNTAEPLKHGMHTKVMAYEIDKAIADFRQGQSTFLVFGVPYRHGKSDMISRALPAYFLGHCADMQPDVISTGYGASLVQKFSRKAMNIIESRPYRELFPSVRLSPLKRRAENWQVEYADGSRWTPSHGEVTAAGLLGALTGSGAHLALVDDYCKSREEAESQTYRDKTWDSFLNNLMTRMAPTSIVIVTATFWHVDDLVARIRQHIDEDENFPNFKFFVFPARGEANLNGRRVPYKTPYLFPERFSESWYRNQYAQLGSYFSSSLLDQDPTVLSGNHFDLSRVHIHDNADSFPDVPYVRAWDLASTEKELAKSDPDFTASVKLGVYMAGMIPHVWIKDGCSMRHSAKRRDERIRAIASRDGAAVQILVEQVGGYKDAVDTLKAIMKGQRIVEGVPVSSDKMVRAIPLAPVFEAGHLHLLRGDWNEMFLQHFREFPYGTHDDYVDCTSIAYNRLMRPASAFADFTDVDIYPGD